MASAYVAVVGPGHDARPVDLERAAVAGRALAERGCVVLTGGLGGVMGAATSGAALAGGLTVGLLPGGDRADAHPDVRVAITTGMGEMRNVLLVRAADAVLAVGGSWGTQSEVSLAVRAGVPVVVLDGWTQPGPGPVTAGSVEEAVELIVDLLNGSTADPGSVQG